MQTCKRFFNWVFCNPDAARGRDTVIQLNNSVILAMTESGRIILAKVASKDADAMVGQVWENGEFNGATLTGLGYAFLGKNGSAHFANEIGATKSSPLNRFELTPVLPHHQFPEWGISRTYPGLFIAINAAIEKGNLVRARWLLQVAEIIANFAGSYEAWHHTDLP